MSDKLKIETQILDDRTEVSFIGKIDEDANFSQLLELNQSKYIFDFQQVELLNSCGIREWISFIEKLTENVSLVYKNCPQIIIEQISMVDGFIKEGSKVESFYAPYFCEKCDKEFKIHLQTDDVVNKQPPEVKCNECEGELEFDDIEEQYFSFIK